MPVRTRKKRAGDSLLGLSIRLSTSLLTFAFVGLVLPFLLLIYTDFPPDIPVYWVLGGLLATPLVFFVFTRRYIKKAVHMTGNTREEWMGLVHVFAAVFAVAGVLLAFSYIGEQPVTRSQCISPLNANVSSPNCQVIETVSLPNRVPLATWE